MQTVPVEAAERLRTLHEAYVRLVNEAVGANRPELADELAAQYDLAAREMTGTPEGSLVALETDGNAPPRRHSTRTTITARLRGAWRSRAAA